MVASAAKPGRGAEPDVEEADVDRASCSVSCESASPTTQIASASTGDDAAGEQHQHRGLEADLDPAARRGSGPAGSGS